LPVETESRISNGGTSLPGSYTFILSVPPDIRSNCSATRGIGEPRPGNAVENAIGVFSSSLSAAIAGAAIRLAASSSFASERPFRETARMIRRHGVVNKINQRCRSTTFFTTIVNHQLSLRSGEMLGRPVAGSQTFLEIDLRALILAIILF